MSNNTGISSAPATFGAAINVTDTTALAALDVSKISVGTKVYSLADAAFFTLTVSTAALSSTVIAVSGVTGARWIKDPPGTDSTPAWLKAARNDADAKSNGTLDSEWFSEFADYGNWFATLSGGLASGLISTSLDGGVIRLITGTTGSGATVIITPGTSNLTPAFVSNVLTKKMYVAWRARIEGPIGANALIRFGIIDPTIATNAFIALTAIGTSVSGSGSNTNWCTDARDGSTETTVALATAIDTASYHTISIYIDGVATAFFYVDGVLVGSAALSQMGAHAGVPFVRCYTNDATSRIVDLDKMYARFAGS